MANRKIKQLIHKKTMSRILDELKRLEQCRNGEDSLAPEEKKEFSPALNQAARHGPQAAGPASPASGNTALAPETPYARKSQFVIRLVVTVFMLSLLALNLIFLFTLKNYASERNITLKKLTGIEALINSNNRQINAISTDIRRLTDDTKAINLNMGSIRAEVKELKDASDAQAFAIKNINKAKDVLFGKINNLEARLDKISALNQPSDN